MKVSKKKEIEKELQEGGKADTKGLNVLPLNWTW